VNTRVLGLSVSDLVILSYIVLTQYQHVADRYLDDSRCAVNTQTSVSKTSSLGVWDRGLI